MVLRLLLLLLHACYDRAWVELWQVNLGWRMRVAGVLVRDSRMNWVHQAELMLSVLLSLPEVVLLQVLQGLWGHLLLSPEPRLFAHVECWSG